MDSFVTKIVIGSFFLVAIVIPTMRILIHYFLLKKSLQSLTWMRALAIGWSLQIQMLSGFYSLRGFRYSVGLSPKRSEALDRVSNEVFNRADFLRLQFLLSYALLRNEPDLKRVIYGLSALFSDRVRGDLMRSFFFGPFGKVFPLGGLGFIFWLFWSVHDPSFSRAQFVVLVASLLTIFLYLGFLFFSQVPEIRVMAVLCDDALEDQARRKEIERLGFRIVDSS